MDFLMILLKLAGLVSVSFIYHGFGFWWHNLTQPQPKRRTKAQQKRRSRFLLNLLHTKQMQLQRRKLEYNTKKRKNKFYK
jgi:hypothetical protein